MLSRDRLDSSLDTKANENRYRYHLRGGGGGLCVWNVGVASLVYKKAIFEKSKTRKCFLKVVKYHGKRGSIDICKSLIIKE